MKTLKGKLNLFISLSMLCGAVSAKDFLPPDVAFKPTMQGDIITIYISEGYYLYKDRITVLSQNKPVKFDFVTKPLTKTFPQFGTYSVYLDKAQLKVTPKLKRPLVIRYQGCSAQGLCYPPQQVTLKDK